MMEEVPQKIQDNLKAHTKAERDQLRVMRHVAKPPRLIVMDSLSPEKRVYLKRFGSRPASKRRAVVVAE